MAGGKKKKSKPAANLARGFATTSIASKARADPTEGAEGTDPASSHSGVAAPPSGPSANHIAPPSPNAQGATANASGAREAAAELSPEEFEKRLEEEELQLLVEKHGLKTKRDAQRQKTRLDTDRRLLRSQAESINIKKWLPPELMDQILDLIQAEGRFSSSTVAGDNSSSGKPLSEEELTIKLWTLKLALFHVGFPDEKVQAVLRYVLDISPNVSPNAKDSIWGFEEALDWLARECPREGLPDYDARGKSVPKSQADTPLDTPLPSGANTPRIIEPNTQSGKNASRKTRAPRNPSPKKPVVTFAEDIEPDELLPAYMDAKTKLFAIQRPLQETSKDPRSKTPKKIRRKDAEVSSTESNQHAEAAKLQAKIDYIEKDILFDNLVAEQQWREKRVVLEKDFAAAKKQKAKAEEEQMKEEEADKSPEVEDDVAAEAERIAAEILTQGDEEDDDQGVADLFASLPVEEVDPETGKTNNVINSADGAKIIIRDFGKWSGVSPMRALEEACRSRDSSVRITYTPVSDVSYASRHLVNISWSKSQDPLPPWELSGIEYVTYPNQFVFKMAGIATPDSKQSEAFIATTALYLTFGGSTKEEKVALRLPPAWKDLWAEYAEKKKNEADTEDRKVVKELRDMVRQKRDQELEDGVLLKGAFRGRGTGRNTTESEDTSNDRLKGPSGGVEYYQQIWFNKASTPKFQKMLHSRMQLPMWAFRQQIVETVEREQVVIICGETGCGKSTQTPSFLLEHQLSQGKQCKIYCTEPRRISAISLARRVSEELGEGKGELGTSRSLVGYAIRLETKASRETRLIYATTGIVMRMLEGSNELKEITHLVLDEVHERTIDSDFLLIVLKKLLAKRKDLKVVLMSATVDAERFSKYLGGAPVLNVPGRTFPVQVRYLEDAVELTGYTIENANQERSVELDDDSAESGSEGSSKSKTSSKDLKQYSPRTRATLLQLDEYRIETDLVVQLISKIASDPSYIPYSRAILVFLPGIAEIRQLNDTLLGDKFFSSNWLVYPLHSTIATEEQENAFLVPPDGFRKIVLATNIAETGITIPDVTCVIDTGKHREMRFDERRQLSRLLDTFISRANAKQRRGRAGRVQEGLCFHMFTKHRHDEVLSDQQTPEMLRLSLQDLAMRVKVCKIGGIEETLGEALDPPSAKNIRRAVDALIDVRALTAAEELTPLGNQLARLPLDVFLGKLLLMGTIFRCLDMAVTVAAILSSKSPFVAPFGQRAQADNARHAFRRADSDLLTVYNAYLAWKRVCQSSTHLGGQEFQFCKKNFLSQQTLANIEDVKGQLLVSLVDSGFLQLTDEERRAVSRLRYSGGSRRRTQNFFELPQRVNVNSDNDVITASVIAWSFYPKLLVRDVPGGKGLRNVGNNQSISLHPSSVNKRHMELRWLSYYHIMQSKQFYNAHETTSVDPFAIALLCGDMRCDMYAGVLVLDGNRARFAVSDWKTALVLKVLRSRLRDLLTRAFKTPGKLPSAQHEKWLDMWQRIFGQEFGARDAGIAGAISALKV